MDSQDNGNPPAVHTRTASQTSEPSGTPPPMHKPATPKFVQSSPSVHLKTYTEEHSLSPQPYHIFDRHTLSAERLRVDNFRVANPRITKREVVYDCTDADEHTAGETKDKSFQQRNEGATLVFESRFEGGNLLRATKVADYEYELLIRPDMHTQDQAQWFHFSVENTRPNKLYRFNIVNLIKGDSLYNYGMLPLVFSEAARRNEGKGWMRDGVDVCYYCNGRKRLCRRSYYTLSFAIEFKYRRDKVFFAHCLPYTYTNLQTDLATIANDQARQACFRRRALCQTLGGNTCDLITITNFESDVADIRRRRCIVLSARVHPGETNSSLVMRGVLFYLTSNSPAAVSLRNRIIFKIIPMLNPDGVIHGNYRTSLAGLDLNRQWKEPGKRLTPTIFFAKQLIQKLQAEREVLACIDIHGHSRRHNIFMYGCENADSVTNKLKERVLPYMMSNCANQYFSLSDCNFLVQRSKLSTARVVLWKELRILNSFTLELSLAGSNFGPLRNTHFQTTHYAEIGRQLCQALLNLSDDEMYRSTKDQVDKNFYHHKQNSLSSSASRLHQGISANDRDKAEGSDSDSDDGSKKKKSRRKSRTKISNFMRERRTSFSARARRLREDEAAGGHVRVNIRKTRKSSLDRGSRGTRGKRASKSKAADSNADTKPTVVSGTNQSEAMGPSRDSTADSLVGAECPGPHPSAAPGADQAADQEPEVQAAPSPPKRRATVSSLLEHLSLSKERHPALDPFTRPPLSRLTNLHFLNVRNPMLDPPKMGDTAHELSEQDARRAQHSYDHSEPAMLLERLRKEIRRKRQLRRASSDFEDMTVDAADTDTLPAEEPPTQPKEPRSRTAPHRPVAVRRVTLPPSTSIESAMMDPLPTGYYQSWQDSVGTRELPPRELRSRLRRERQLNQNFTQDRTSGEHLSVTGQQWEHNPEATLHTGDSGRHRASTSRLLTRRASPVAITSDTASVRHTDSVASRTNAQSTNSELKLWRRRTDQLRQILRDRSPGTHQPPVAALDPGTIEAAAAKADRVHTASVRSKPRSFTAESRTKPSAYIRSRQRAAGAREVYAELAEPSGDAEPRKASRASKAPRRTSKGRSSSKATKKAKKKSTRSRGTSRKRRHSKDKRDNR